MGTGNRDGKACEGGAEGMRRRLKWDSMRVGGRLSECGWEVVGSDVVLGKW